jgi:Phage gp6-like head-tail connector protein
MPKLLLETGGALLLESGGAFVLDAWEAAALAAGPPVMGRPALVRGIALAAAPLATGRPAPGGGALAQGHALAAAPLAAGPAATSRGKIIGNGMGGFMFLTLDEAKRHLRVDHAADDADIAEKLAAAEEEVAEHMGRPLPWLDADGVEVPAPPAVKAAVLLLLGDIYAYREAQTDRRLTDNGTALRMLSRYRLFT